MKSILAIIVIVFIVNVLIDLYIGIVPFCWLFSEGPIWL